MLYFVYILKSNKDGKFYTGSTVDLDKRLREYDRGDKATRLTINRGPFSLIHVETVDNLDEARKLEKYFKSGYGRDIRNEIANMVAVAQR